MQCKYNITAIFVISNQTTRLDSPNTSVSSTTSAISVVEQWLQLLLIVDKIYIYIPTEQSTDKSRYSLCCLLVPERLCWPSRTRAAPRSATSYCRHTDSRWPASSMQPYWRRRMLVWAQDELDKKRVRYPHMVLSSGQIEEPKWSRACHSRSSDVSVLCWQVCVKFYFINNKFNECQLM